MHTKYLYSILFFGFICFYCNSQDTSNNVSYTKAYNLAYEGKHREAKDILVQIVAKNPTDTKARSLLASTYSWSRQYNKARNEFNKLISKNKNNRRVWIAAIKNELYAKEDAIALGIANKALMYVQNDKEIERLKEITLKRITSKKYPKLGWYNKESSVQSIKDSKKKSKEKPLEKESLATKTIDTLDVKTPTYKDPLNNRFSIRNLVTVFNDRYDPMFYSSISYKRQTLAGSIIPRINYSHRLGKDGVQYELDFYPKFSKRFYAYLNYGFSNASIYPNHKFAGDLYTNLPGAFEFSAGGRYIGFKTRNVVSITNSFGHYRGNYYFSLRSYITPRPNNLTRVSGNLLVRKYLKDADNYWGVNFGMGVSPELRQIISGDVVLAETQLFIESQRLSLEYQFTGKKKKSNIYKANIAVRRQEQIINSKNFLWAVSAGITYNVKF